MDVSCLVDNAVRHVCRDGQERGAALMRPAQLALQLSIGKNKKASPLNGAAGGDGKRMGI